MIFISRRLCHFSRDCSDKIGLRYSITTCSRNLVCSSIDFAYLFKHLLQFIFINDSRFVRVANLENGSDDAWNFRKIGGLLCICCGSGICGCVTLKCTDRDGLGGGDHGSGDDSEDVEEFHVVDFCVCCSVSLF